MNQTIKEWAFYPRLKWVFSIVWLALATVSVFNLPLFLFLYDCMRACFQGWLYKK